ncbi:MAG: hypothetical protein KF916_01845 [Microbacteriaceae bacterium]|nr:hypothetical protein [Microbacteriaceae bacterium]
MYKIVSALTLALVLTGSAGVDSAEANTCPAGYKNYGSTCVKVGNTGDSVKISANKQTTNTDKSSGVSDSSKSSKAKSSKTTDVSVGPSSVLNCGSGCKVVILHRGGQQVKILFDTGKPETKSPATQQKKITLSDIAHFKPNVPVQQADPFPIAFDSTPVNFWSDAKPHTVRGRLLEVTAEVRFTPETYHWNFGDGNTLKSNTAGEPRSAGDYTLSTATSHVFNQIGNFTIRHSVTYSAQYRISGENWLSIEGGIEVEGNPLNIYLASPKSLLIKN